VTAEIVPLEEAERLAARDGIVIRRGDEIAPQAVRWLWPGWLAAGKLHLLAGAPGTGKTTLSLAFAALISRGAQWPDGSHAPMGDTLIWSGEDDAADSILPRFLANGGDSNRLHVVEGTRENGRRRPFDPATDMGALIAAARGFKNLRLAIVDPLVLAVAGDSHKNAEVRRGLQPLVELGATLDAAVLGVTHYSKGTHDRDPTERVTGSLAFAAQARLVMATVKPREAGLMRRLVRCKSNIGSDGGGFEYDLERRELANGIAGQAVEWGERLHGDARDLIGEIEKPNSGSTPAPACSAAGEWLMDQLAAGPMPVADLKRRATEARHSWASVRRAKNQIGAVASKAGTGWEWALPDTPRDDPTEVF